MVNSLYVILSTVIFKIKDKFKVSANDQIVYENNDPNTTH